MDLTRTLAWSRPLVLFLSLASCTTTASSPMPGVSGDAGSAQVPSWSPADLLFFLHGSMGTEVVPELLLRAFTRSDPDLFPREDLTNFGLVPDPDFGWPIGLSRRDVPHLGNLASVGVNCASCHSGELAPVGGGATVRVLGAASHFDAEAFFGAVTVATFRVGDPQRMKRFLAAYLAVSDPASGEGGQTAVAEAWRRQEPALVAAIVADPVGATGVAPGRLHEISGEDLRLDRARLASGADLVPLARAVLKLCHNIRAALHIPDQLPDTPPPASGPGRNDAFGLLSAALFGVPQPYAPVKYGVVWNLEQRPWVHWDGNTRSPIGRNLLASLGLGAPLLGKRARLDFAMVNRQTELSETIRAPRYPFAVDSVAAARGAASFAARCAGCHTVPENDARLHATSEIGTDPRRAENFTPAQAERLNRLLAELELPGYTPPATPDIRGTQRYWTPSLAGVWARSPYLHNGSIRTMQEMLTPPAARAKTFRRGSRLYDGSAMGYADDGPYVLNTSAPGQSNAGHAYGTDLTEAQKRDLIEFLKTL